MRCGRRGGFDGRSKRGYAITAAGPDGRPLKPYRLIRETNGRHLLLPLYQGCFIAESKALPRGGPLTSLYQVIGFIGRDGKLYAKNQCLCSSGDSFFYIPDERGRSGSLFWLDGVCSLYGK